MPVPVLARSAHHTHTPVFPVGGATLEALAVVPSVPVALIPDVSLALALASAAVTAVAAVTGPSVAFAPGEVEVELWV
jgi:hypothetical protein